MNDKATRVLPRPRPRPVSDWEDAEENALEWARWLGFAGARRTPGGADRGLDIDGPGVYGQVKFHGRAVAPHLIQQLFGARGRREGEMLFFSNSGYTKAALECADDLGVSCFRYSPSDGEVTSCNASARRLTQRAQRPVEAGEGSPSRTVKEFTEPVFLDADHAEFSPDGSMIAYKDTLTSVRVEEWPSRKEIATFAEDSEVLGLEFVTPALLAIHFPFLNETVIWDVRADTVQRTIGERPDHGRPAMAYVRRVECGGRVVTTFGHAGPGCWSALTGERQDSFRFPGVNTMTDTLVSWGMSPQGVPVACFGRRSGKKRSWNLHIGDRSQQIATESHGAVLSRFAFTSDGSLMAAVGHSPDIEIWDVDQAERIAVLRTGHPLLGEDEDALEAMAFSADDSLLAVGGRDRTVRLWDMRLREEIALLEGCEDDVSKISFSPDGRLLVASDESGTARLWDLADRPASGPDRHR
ncbi:restriction endonuclease [Streptomyces olivaceoviridis]|uniref:restriction endonuclease n=1 Tax=Streptomyces olivaceoviridis TaxID=1921 RepID=UPI003688C20D